VDYSKLNHQGQLSLSQYHDYSREEVHDIFAFGTPFTPQAGTWGLHGIVAIPERPNDFVFFVTFGQTQGDHVFDEGVTEDGVLTWQSQPRQGLGSEQIQQLIRHDELQSSIFLFLRTNKRHKYTYLGQLKYLSHDSDRENPVFFQWQILEWDISNENIEEIGLELQPGEKSQRARTLKPAKKELSRTPGLSKESPPIGSRRGGVETEHFRAKKSPDYSDVEARNRKLGLAGEELVLEYEKTMLMDAGRLDLAEMVQHTSKVEGDGAGYDIKSFTTTGEMKYIEVKTTKAGARTAFYLSQNELAFSRSHQDAHYLCRVYGYDEVSKSGTFYVVRGDFENTFQLTPTEYRVTLTGN
jgi:hypothetical protein